MPQLVVTFFFVRVQSPEIAKENLGIIVEYKVKVRVIMAYAG